MTIDSETTVETKQLVQHFYGCAARGDFQGVFSSLAGDMILHEPPYLPYGGDYAGHDGFRAAIGVVTEYFDLARLHVDYLVAEQDRAFVVVRVPAYRGGEAFLAEEFRVRDGKIVYLRIYGFDMAAIPLVSR